VVTEVGVSTG